MSIKRILVPLPGALDHTSEIETALSAARVLGAQVEALCISEPFPAGAGMSAIHGGYTARGMALRPADWLVEEREQRSRQQRLHFAEACSKAGIPLLSPGIAADTLPAAIWREREGEFERIALERVAAFDLMVATSAALVEVLKDLAERALLRTRRPVLLAPQRLTGSLTDPAVVAWDESLQCWHAVSAAIPFLRLARRVEVVSIDRDAAARETSQAEVLAYLRCQGVAATARVIAPEGLSIGETVLDIAAETRAGLLVMGGYAHGRLREMLLGGATRHVLRNAAATPVLMAH